MYIHTQTDFVCVFTLFFLTLQYSICSEPLIELSNPGASGSLFFVTSDDEFIIKTVQHKEAEFLQKLLPGYYMVRGCSQLQFLPWNFFLSLEGFVPAGFPSFAFRLCCSIPWIDFRSNNQKPAG